MGVRCGLRPPPKLEVAPVLRQVSGVCGYGVVTVLELSIAFFTGEARQRM